MQNIQWIARLLTHSASVALILAFLYWLISKMSPGAKAFWLGVFSDEGTPSFSRVATGILVVACVVWDSYLCFVNHALPDFSGQALLIGTPYGLNVSAKAVSKLRNPDGSSSTTVTSTTVQSETQNQK
ncbi:MAG TPA: hypothetical protein VKT80_09505 [Chloroflexota bacterium]|nr:hypothetical protein [Chloroflexota bacterium]